MKIVSLARSRAFLGLVKSAPANTDVQTTIERLKNKPLEAAKIVHPRYPVARAAVEIKCATKTIKVFGN
jgi:hypothetical protein